VSGAAEDDGPGAEAAVGEAGASSSPSSRNEASGARKELYSSSGASDGPIGGEGSDVKRNWFSDHLMG